jgi:hypothetical protein
MLCQATSCKGRSAEGSETEPVIGKSKTALICTFNAALDRTPTEGRYPRSMGNHGRSPPQCPDVDEEGVSNNDREACRPQGDSGTRVW